MLIINLTIYSKVFLWSKNVKKVLNHPDKDKIISKLIEGESLRDVESWLKKNIQRRKDFMFHI